MAITDWPLRERPREKLLRLGTSSLSEAELLAIFLQKGIKGKTAVDLARELLSEFKTLRTLLSAPEAKVASFSGIGKAKFSMLQAALELGKRYFEEDLALNTSLSSAQDAKKFLISKLSGYKQEVFSCIFLNNRHKIIEYKELFFGTVNCAPIYPRIIAQRALEYNASAVILAHNHPSGDASPSKSDILTTNNLVVGLAYIDIKILDHIIIGGNRSISFVEQGLL